MKPKRCKGCNRPVRETVGKSGYCKKCIALAKKLNDEREVRDANPTHTS